MTSKGLISFFSSKFAKLQNLATGPSAAPVKLDIWHMFKCLYGRTKRCLNMSFTQFVGHLLNFTRDETVTAKGDFLGQRDLLNTQYPLIIKNRAESRFKLQNKAQD